MGVVLHASGCFRPSDFLQSGAAGDFKQLCPRVCVISDVTFQAVDPRIDGRFESDEKMKWWFLGSIPFFPSG